MDKFTNKTIVNNTWLSFFFNLNKLMFWWMPATCYPGTSLLKVPGSRKCASMSIISLSKAFSLTLLKYECLSCWKCEQQNFYTNALINRNSEYCKKVTGISPAQFHIYTTVNVWNSLSTTRDQNKLPLSLSQGPRIKKKTEGDVSKAIAIIVS